jgi:hypothetical protein
LQKGKSERQKEKKEKSSECGTCTVDAYRSAALIAFTCLSTTSRNHAMASKNGIDRRDEDGKLI